MKKTKKGDYKTYKFELWKENLIYYNPKEKGIMI